MVVGGTMRVIRGGELAPARAAVADVLAIRRSGCTMVRPFVRMP
jgi:hypothetical protein